MVTTSPAVNQQSVIRLPDDNRRHTSGQIRAMTDAEADTQTLTATRPTPFVFCMFLHPT